MSGTPGYMAPEQTRGEPVSAASDCVVSRAYHLRIAYREASGKPVTIILEVFTADRAVRRG